MAATGLRRFTHRISRLTTRIKGLFVQDCPDELYACEVCRQIDCDSDEWISCENRLNAYEAFRINSENSPQVEADCSYLRK